MDEGRRTLDQRRAKHAWESVRKAGESSDRSDYARESKRLPVRIRTSGLGQAVAFLGAKKNDGDARTMLLNHLGDWLLVERGLAARPGGEIGPDAVRDMIVNGDSGLLRRMTEETLAYLRWLTRFCEAEIRDEEDERNGP